MDKQPNMTDGDPAATSPVEAPKPMSEETALPAATPKKCCCRRNGMLQTWDWLSDIPQAAHETDYIEVQFKNTRKGFYLNSTKIPLKKGDVVAVESSPGHDIGVVTLTGGLVLLQMRKYNLSSDTSEVRRVYRIARPGDMEKYEEAKGREHSTMLRARVIAQDLKLNMKIGDVEYQGDGNKAIFYYIADERVDFRQLIKVLADTFKVRIEMKQIGARQEAGRIGGIGPCGRPLCCSSWMTGFVSVATSAARHQDISLNPQKLAGQCAKLKCCLNYEVDDYVESQKRLPSREIVLETKDAQYYHFKSDILGGVISYSTSKDFPANLVNLTIKEAFEVINMNKRGERPLALVEKIAQPKEIDFSNTVGEDSLTRFDKKEKGKEKEKRAHRDNNRRDVKQTDHNRGENRNNEGKRGEKQKSGNRPQRNDNRPPRREDRSERKPLLIKRPKSDAGESSNS